MASYGTIRQFAAALGLREAKYLKLHSLKKKQMIRNYQKYQSLQRHF